MAFHPKQFKKIAQLLDDGISLHRSRQPSVPTPNSFHPGASRAGHVHLGVVSNEDSVIGFRAEALQSTAKYLRIWFADAFGIGNQDRIKNVRET